uniref:uncharacterized protein LOC122587953 n=1 Tax=Erigeron canadensis TaxID=72917 RepID=UPI001CB8AC8F|nr:uncharacterized protein LOC122587953 [Erigeron canadensis]
MVENERLNSHCFNQHVLRVAPLSNLANATEKGNDDASTVGNHIILPSSFTVVYTIEFQKRGLPHCHVCLFLKNGSKLPTPEDIDRVICSEIPDKELELDLYQIVCDNMLHGPCGIDREFMPCMTKGKCTKRFPKDFNEHTYIDEDGYAVYRRRKDGNHALKSGIPLDNRSIVPYNKVLMRKFQAHMNLERCNQLGSIKYLFKYVNKGPDRIRAGFFDPEKKKDKNKQDSHHDEIGEFYNCRYLFACEAAWRLFGFEIHYRHPSVEVLSFHLENEQPVVYQQNQQLKKISKRKWTKRNQQPALGRLIHASPKSGQLYYLRILLNKVKGPTSYDDIKRVNGTLHETFKDACYALGLLDDDREYIASIKETYEWATASYCRSLFVMLVTSDTLCNPDHVFKESYKYLSDDVVHVRQREMGVTGLKLNPKAIFNLTLSYIETLLLSSGMSLKDIPNMPMPDDRYIAESCNMLIQDELNYDPPAIEVEHRDLYANLIEEQQNKTLAAAIRSKGEIVINVASSGIAALLLSGGRTAHSRFAIPINLNEDSFCYIKPDSDLSELLNKAKLIIWDKAPMMHRHCFEAFDRTLRDIIRSPYKYRPYGGKTVVFGGDFRQILPVIPKGNRTDIVNASMHSSRLWRECTVLRLTVNMRLQIGCPSAEIAEAKQFAEWILKIGEGKLGGNNEGEVIVEFPEDVIIPSTGDHIKAITSAIYPDFKII